MSGGRSWFRMLALVLGFAFLYIPIVSLSVYSRPWGVLARRTVGSSVAKSAFWTMTPAPVNAFNKLDLPAFV